MNAVYDELRRGYTLGRRPDPRWAAAVRTAVGQGATVVNVGAGAGSYEDGIEVVLAVEPSTTMLAQRGPGAAPAVRAVAGHLPLRDAAVDVALAVLTIHHWPDPAARLAELRRVAHRQVVLTFDPAATAAFWLVREYVPEVAALDDGRTPAVAEVAALLDTVDVRPLPVPHDMVDGVLAAHWARPHAYLDAGVRARASGLAQLDPDVVDAGVARLRADLASGAWERRHGALWDRADLDVGYRLVVGGMLSSR